MKLSLTLFCCAFLLFGGLSAQVFHTPAELLAIMDSSTLTYVVAQANENTPTFPRGPRNTAFNYQEMTAEGPQIGTLAMSEKAAEFFNAGEDAYFDKSYKEAIGYYKKALKMEPQCSIAATYVGQCYRELGDLKAAQEWFEKAIDLNYHDYMAHWMLSSVVLKNKDKKRAMREITIAWILNRNYSLVKESVGAVYKECGKKFDDFEFEPHFWIEKVGDEVKIEMEVEWMMYVFCKALWKYEPDYHAELGGGRSAFDMQEEKECIANLLIAHDTEFGKKPSKIPAINALKTAVENDQINAFIFMEIWIPQEPLIIFTQPPSAIEEIADYVLDLRVK